MTTTNANATLHPILSPEALAEIYAHARRDYPEECCGIIYGPKSAPVADRALALGQAGERPEHHLFAVVDGIPARFGDVVVADILTGDVDRDQVFDLGHV